MIYKWLGAGLILFMGGYASVCMNRMEHRRLMVLDGYISLLRYIKGQINCYAMPMEDILHTADPYLIAACLGEVRKRDERTNQDGCRSLSHMIRTSRLYMEPETERLLLNFSSELGQTFREEQVMRCEDYILALGVERNKLADAAPARMRINRALSMSAAMGLAILLW
ncbi:MAG: hypothetical protein E7645_05825 [Ruminococcaceae bacterium]|nr:hypothetical protein [Oscillospiraceae bacterium]